MKKGLKKGFTLIELLVVVAIIGILATIIIINVAKARGRAADAKVLADMNGANKTAAACVSDESGTLKTALPSAGADICTAQGTWTDHWPDIAKAGNGSSGAAWKYVGTFTTTPAVATTPVKKATTDTGTGYGFAAESVNGSASDSPWAAVACEMSGCAKGNF